MARQIADANVRWSKGAYPAGLHYGDRFAYALANEPASPLLFVDDNFSRTDLRSAIGSM